jgi:rare lipoprotein A
MLPRPFDKASRLPSLAALTLVVLLAACGSTPRATGPRAVAVPVAAGDRDGAEAKPPADLAAVPDAEPRLEAIRSGGPNKPYAIAGRSYAPVTDDKAFAERGLASWYGKKFHGRRTASGEVYDMYAMTAAHKTLPIPSYARVRNPANGAEVLVRINDRGPFVAGRIVDLSYTAALKLGVLRGVVTVELERITFDEIRTGVWRRGEAPTAVAVAVPPPAPTSVVAPASAEISFTAGPEPPPAAAALPAEAGTAAMPASPGFWVQLGVFRVRDGAQSFHQRVAAELDWLAPLLAVFNDETFFRLQAGPYPSRDEALGSAARIREALQLVTVIVERR